MTERQLEYARMSNERLVLCLKQEVLKVGRLTETEIQKIVKQSDAGTYEFQEIEEAILRRMADPTTELIPGIQGEPFQINPPPFNPEKDLPGGILPDPEFKF